MPDESGRLRAAVRVHDLAAYAVEPGAEASAQLAVLTALADAIGCDCAALTRWDPVAGTHVTTANGGYPAPAAQALARVFHTAPEFPALRANGRPLRALDIPAQRRDGRMFSEFIEPFGFSDGVSVCLSVHGRYVGAVHASTTGTRKVDDDSLALLRLLARDLATLVDPFRGELQAMGTGHEGGAFAWAADSDTVVALTRSARPSLVTPGSSARELLAAVARSGAPGVRITALVGRELVQIDASRRGRWLICEHREIVSPAGLSLRELEVLAEIASGKTNLQVAAALAISERTVTAHIERILRKLGVRNRTAAAAEAARMGLVRVRPAPRV